MSGDLSSNSLCAPTKEELTTFLTAWISDGSLQTFTSREKFRKEARFFIQKLGLTDEPKNDHCEVCEKQLPHPDEWSMPSCPDCQEVLEFLGELQADYADREREGKAELVGSAIKLITRRASSPPPESHSADHLQRYTDWLVKEMPAGTVIGDPTWWARKLLAAACVFADEAPEAPRLTDHQCDEIIAALETYEWTGFARDDIRLIAGTINTYRDASTKVAAHESPLVRISNCGSCSYEEADGELIEQCAKCKAADAAPSIDLLDELRKNLSGETSTSRCQYCLAPAIAGGCGWPTCPHKTTAPSETEQ